MTVVAALVHDDTVWMGGDSAAVDGDDLSTPRIDKVFTLGEWVVGYCESFRLGQVVRFRLRLAEQRCADPVEHLATVVVDELRKQLHRSGVAKSTGDEDEMPGALVLARAGRLFTIESDFAVLEHDTYTAVGCGAPYALGSLASTVGDPAQRIAAALTAADRHSTGVAGPFTILNTQEP